MIHEVFAAPIAESTGEGGSSAAEESPEGSSAKTVSLLTDSEDSWAKIVPPTKARASRMQDTIFFTAKARQICVGRVLVLSTKKMNKTNRGTYIGKKNLKREVFISVKPTDQPIAGEQRAIAEWLHATQ